MDRAQAKLAALGNQASEVIHRSKFHTARNEAGAFESRQQGTSRASVNCVTSREHKQRDSRANQILPHVSTTIPQQLVTSRTLSRVHHYNPYHVQLPALSGLQPKPTPPPLPSAKYQVLPQPTAALPTVPKLDFPTAKLPPTQLVSSVDSAFQPERTTSITPSFSTTTVRGQSNTAAQAKTIPSAQPPRPKGLSEVESIAANFFLFLGNTFF